MESRSKVDLAATFRRAWYHLRLSVRDQARVPTLDAITLTASSLEQAELYNWHLARTKRIGCIAPSTITLAVPDPLDQHIGSGAATLNSILALANHCIELYTVDNGEQRVGFYSLEIGADLELDPKQYHVVAFEDVGDGKNLCYIIQAHMEMLGSGNAFVVSRPPKDAFREAKANGFGVTVVGKGQLLLNIDQTLEGVEEMIVEIGSKIYHDKIMKAEVL